MINDSDTMATTSKTAKVKAPKLFSKAGVVMLYLAIVGIFLSLQLLGIYLFAPMVFSEQVLTPAQRFGMGSFDGTVTSYSMFFTLFSLSAIIYIIIKWRLVVKVNERQSYAAMHNTSDGSVLSAKDNAAINHNTLEQNSLEQSIVEQNRLNHNNALSSYGVSDYLAIKSFPMYVAMGMIGLWLVFIIGAEILTFVLDKDPTAFVDDLYASANPQWLLIVAMVFVAPIYEELMFRGILWRSVEEQFDGKKGVVMASIITSILFSIIHLQYESFEMSIVFILALLLSFARAKSGSIILPILIHMINNGLAMWLYVMLH